LNIEWDFSKAYNGTTEQIDTDYTKLLDKPGAVARKQGDAAGQLAKGKITCKLNSIFRFLPMQPWNP